VKTNKLLSLLILVILVQVSCKKNEDNNSDAKQKCKLVRDVRVYNGYIDTSDYSYSNNQLISISTSSRNGTGPAMTGVRRYSYSGNMVLLTYDPQTSVRDTVFIDSTGRILRQHITNPAFTGLQEIVYHYNTEDVIQKANYFLNGKAYDSTLYTILNGDMVQQANFAFGDTFVYEYYTDRHVPASGYFTQNQVNTGTSFIHKNAHLIKSGSALAGSGRLEYTYETDEIGNITTRTATQINTGMAEVENYYYSCE
jgi:hypothetical protein